MKKHYKTTKNHDVPIIKKGDVVDTVKAARRIKTGPSVWKSNPANRKPPTFV